METSPFKVVCENQRYKVINSETSECLYEFDETRSVISYDFFLIHGVHYFVINYSKCYATFTRVSINLTTRVLHERSNSTIIFLNVVRELQDNMVELTGYWYVDNTEQVCTVLVKENSDFEILFAPFLDAEKK